MTAKKINKDKEDHLKFYDFNDGKYKQFEPMLAAKCQDVEALRYPLLASPKLDGIRAVVRGDKIFSRNLKEIPNLYTRRLFGRYLFNGIDGELIVGVPYGKDVFRTTSSGVMSKEGEPEVYFHVFDACHNGIHAEEFRKRHLSLMPFANKKNRIVRVHHTLVVCASQLLELEEQYLEMGYEGLMLRDPSAKYKFGRSTMKEHGLMKLKRFEDSEALILNVVERLHNGNEATTNELGKTKRSSHKANMVRTGTMGALSVRDIHSGVEFEIGTGFDDEMRRDFWQNDYIGRVVKYKFFPTGSKDKPRFPVFLGFRTDI